MFAACRRNAGLALLAVSLLVCLSSGADAKLYRGALSPEQLAKHRRIAMERFGIFALALATGGAAGWAACGNGDGESATACVALAAGVAYAVYTVCPKSAWMLEVRAGEQPLAPEQAALWLRAHRAQTLRYHAGFAVALAGYAVWLRDRRGATDG
jgi:hypothetical protein